MLGVEADEERRERAASIEKRLAGVKTMWHYLIFMALGMEPFLWADVLKSAPASTQHVANTRSSGHCMDNDLVKLGRLISTHRYTSAHIGANNAQHLAKYSIHRTHQRAPTAQKSLAEQRRAR